MKYCYVVAFQLIGVVKPSAELERFTLDLSSTGTRARLTSDLDTLPQEVDEAAAIGSLLLKSFIGRGNEGTSEERVAQEVEELRRRRRTKTGEDAFLIVQADGDITDFNPQPQHELDNYIVAIDDAPKEEIRSRHESSIHGLLAAIAISSEHLCGAKKVADSVIFVRKDGKPLYCYTLSGSGNLYVSSPLVQDTWVQVLQDAKTLSRHQALVDPARLLTRSLTEGNDPLMSFLSVWFGLEIFVNKNFKAYENRILVRLSSGNPPVVPQGIVQRISSVMSDKYRLNDKFSVISSELTDSNAEADQKTFDSIYKARCKLLHGEDIPLVSLPTAEAQRLLRKYLRLHLSSDGD